MDILTIHGVRGYVDETGTAQLNLEDTVRGLGFIKSETKNGKEYSSIRWERVFEYLSEFDFDHKWAKDSYIPENIFYRLAMKARNEVAEAFQAKVADEILPSIRKHGIYATDNVIDNILNNPDFGIELLTKLKEERAARVQAERTNAILMHVNKTYTATEIAKELGFKSAIALNHDLGNRKIQFRQNDTWLLYSRYADCGYVEIKQEVLDNGKVIYHRRFTQIGREWLLKIYNKEQSKASVS
ncbi:phage antirepressor KilAC domain-containing protein [Paenibacillus kribbensis]|uniref:phage antirepressor KilAC domain-containing protein n=1 Tax=Paenibacillus kribbensis TaxID=172713 RepID=UPI002DB82E4E|nr:phage antirepressor KilAC domain-containing protein [Paenibacillus kribbensis]MEC0235250.1 phage antirepressor KilAC domain-containing protein [Paenibacillus kribbensis]